MKKLRSNMERFFFRNRNKGIPNLIVWVLAANALFFLVNTTDPSGALYSLLVFDRSAILRGQVWRLFSFIFLELSGENLFWAVFAAIFYYQMGLSLENAWGTFKFNIYYLTGWLMSVVAGFIFGYTSISYVHLSLFLAFATLYPDTEFRIFFIIPIKARWLGIIDLALYLILLLDLTSFPWNLLPLFALANYFLYFGKDFVQIFPDSWRINARRLTKKSRQPQGHKTIPFRQTGSYEGDKATPKAPYTHKCTLCGRTDVSNPDLEFRYCSKCKGYHCYCTQHINSHTHISE